MSLRYYDIGDIAELRFGFTSRELTTTERRTFEAGGPLPSGIGVEPDQVVCTVRKPDGSTVTPTVTGGDGIYTTEQELDQRGAWWYAADGVGGHQASGERRLQVRKQQVPR